ncbi:ricin-type beta-trefoil lectin domain protein [Actinoallomurus sp. NPDC050550]|uniref:RICIN domain-containing protein n=1 Tax=Actinoallomurus sp. NPDC050550 TaxID=3154937 RepID=UPI0033E90412
MNRITALRTVAKGAGLALGTMLAAAAAPLTLSPGTAYASGPTMCLDVGNTRNNNDPVQIWQCAVPGDAFVVNQQFVIDGGQIKVANTVGTNKPMCLDVGNTRNNNDPARIWQCQNPVHTNQKFVIEHGQIKVADTIGTNRPMCLDITPNRNNGARALIYQCAASYESNIYNQRFVIEHSMIKVADTLR